LPNRCAMGVGTCGTFGSAVWVKRRS
jgi:hypothetical protein